VTWRFLPFAVLVALLGCGGGGVAGTSLALCGAEVQTMSASLPTGLITPVRVADINLRGVIDPFGVVRSSLTSS
jgi:hypothetical protein